MLNYDSNKKNRNNQWEESWLWKEAYEEEDGQKTGGSSYFFYSPWLFYLLITFCVLFMFLSAVKIMNALTHNSLFSGYGLFLLLLIGIFLFYLQFFARHKKYNIPLHSLLLLLSVCAVCVIWNFPFFVYVGLLFLFFYICFSCLLAKNSDYKDNEDHVGSFSSRNKTPFSCSKKHPLEWVRRNMKRYSIKQVEEMQESLRLHFESQLALLKSENRNLRLDNAELIRQRDERNRKDWEKSYKDFSRQKQTVADRGSFSFFEGCTTAQMVEKRHSKLAIAYHPDNEYGNEAIMKVINEQYLKEVQKYKR